MASSSSSSSKTLKLKSSDDQEFEVDESVAMMSGLLKSKIEQGASNDTIHLSEVRGELLSKVIEYCKKHVHDQEMENWDSRFVTVNDHIILGLQKAADYMVIPNLSSWTSSAIMVSVKKEIQRRRLGNRDAAK
ncbi:hypothetical protein AAC387_Pa01g1089 [Persea americana]